MSLKIDICPIYDHFFSNVEKKERELEIKQDKNLVDFCISTQYCLLQRVQNIAMSSLMFSAKCFLLPLVITRFILARLIMIPLYPVQSILYRFDPNTRKQVMKRLNTKGDLDLAENKETVSKNICSFKRGNFIAIEVILKNEGIKYSGILVAHKDTIRNGNWAIQAVGNAATIEDMVEDYANFYHKSKINLLMINGPSVGESEGRAWPETMGASQEVGISFLERAIKARKIALIGHSLGGSSMGQAILQHDFDFGIENGIKYEVIDEMTFDKTSNICANIFGGWFTKFLVKFAGLEIDSILASKKLRKLNIPEVIIQAGKRDFDSKKDNVVLDDFSNDGVIPPAACKGYGLIKEGIKGDDLTRFKGVLNLNHCDWGISSITMEELKNFYGVPKISNNAKRSFFSYIKNYFF